ADAPALPLPEASAPFQFPFFREAHGYHTAMETRLARGEFGSGRAAAWMRQRVPLVPGAPPSPLERVLIAADSGSGVSAAMDLRRRHVVLRHRRADAVRPAVRRGSERLRGDRLERGVPRSRAGVDDERPRRGAVAVPARSGGERADRALPRVGAPRRPATALPALNGRARAARGGRRAAGVRVVGRVIA